MRDQLDGQLDVAQRWPESHRNEREQHFQRANVQPRYLRTQRNILPKTRIVGDLSPATTDAGQTTNLPMRQIRKYMQQHLVGQLLNCLWEKQSTYVYISLIDPSISGWILPICLLPYLQRDYAWCHRTGTPGTPLRPAGPKYRSKYPLLYIV